MQFSRYVAFNRAQARLSVSYGWMGLGGVGSGVPKRPGKSRSGASSNVKWAVTGSTGKGVGRATNDIRQTKSQSGYALSLSGHAWQLPVFSN